MSDFYNGLAIVLCIVVGLIALINVGIFFYNHNDVMMELSIAVFIVCLLMAGHFANEMGDKK